MSARPLLLRVLRSSVAKYGAASLLPRGFAIVTTVLLTPLAVEKIGVVGFGYWVLATQVPSLVVSPDLGLTQALINDLTVTNRRLGDLTSQRHRLASLARLLWVVAIAWFVVGAIVAGTYSLAAVSGIDAASLAAALVIGLACFTPGIPAMVWSRAQLAQERGHEALLWEGVGKASSLILSITVLLVSPNVLMLVVAHMLPTTVAAWLNGRQYTRREFRGMSPMRYSGLTETYQQNKQVFLTGRYFVVMQVAYLVGTSVDPYLIGGVLDSGSVAYANLLKRPFDLLPIFITLFSASLWPVFTRLWQGGERRRLRKMVFAVTIGGAGFVLLMSLIIVMLRVPVYDFLTAGHFVPRLIDLVATGVLVAAGVVVTIVSSLLNAVGTVRAQAVVLLSSAVVGVVAKTAVLMNTGLEGYFLTSAFVFVFTAMVPMLFLAFRSIRL